MVTIRYSKGQQRGPRRQTGSEWGQKVVENVLNCSLHSRAILLVLVMSLALEVGASIGPQRAKEEQQQQSGPGSGANDLFGQSVSADQRQEQQQQQQQQRHQARQVINGNHATYVEPPADFKPIIYEPERQFVIGSGSQTVGESAASPVEQRQQQQHKQRQAQAADSEPKFDLETVDSPNELLSAASVQHPEYLMSVPVARRRRPSTTSAPAEQEARAPEAAPLGAPGEENGALEEHELGGLKPSIGRWSDWTDMSIEPDLASSDSSQTWALAGAEGQQQQRRPQRRSSTWAAASAAPQWSQPAPSSLRTRYSAAGQRAQAQQQTHTKPQVFLFDSQPAANGRPPTVQQAPMMALAPFNHHHLHPHHHHNHHHAYHQRQQYFFLPAGQQASLLQPMALMPMGGPLPLAHLERRHQVPINYAQMGQINDGSLQRQHSRLASGEQQAPAQLPVAVPVRGLIYGPSLVADSASINHQRRPSAASAPRSETVPSGQQQQQQQSSSLAASSQPSSANERPKLATSEGQPLPQSPTSAAHLASSRVAVRRARKWKASPTAGSATGANAEVRVLRDSWAAAGETALSHQALVAAAAAAAGRPPAAPSQNSARSSPTAQQQQGARGRPAPVKPQQQQPSPAAQQQPTATNATTTSSPQQQTVANQKRVLKRRRIKTQLPVGLSSWFLGGIRDLDGRHWQMPADLVAKLAVNDVDLQHDTMPQVVGSNLQRGDLSIVNPISTNNNTNTEPQQQQTNSQVETQGPPVAHQQGQQQQPASPNRLIPRRR